MKKMSAKNRDEQLTRFLREHPDTSLIIMDTLQKVREVGGDNYSYANDYQIITRLKTFAGTYSICLMVVHYTRKQKADDAFDMISGTNGLMDAADGTFLLQKEKCMSDAATLEVSGRDQQDQRLYLKRNEEKLCWDLDRIETRLWEAPPEPLLEEVAKRITADCPEGSGSPTELCGFLRVDMKANALTQKLNVHAGRLLQEYGIRYWNKRSHAGRQVGLRLAQRDDVFDSGGGLKKTVTIDTDRHARFRRMKGSPLGSPCPSESTTAPFDGSAVKSAFALLSQKVTKARCCRSGWKGCDLI